MNVELSESILILVRLRSTAAMISNRRATVSAMIGVLRNSWVVDPYLVPVSGVPEIIKANPAVYDA